MRRPTPPSVALLLCLGCRPESASDEAAAPPPPPSTDQPLADPPRTTPPPSTESKTAEPTTAPPTAPAAPSGAGLAAAVEAIHRPDVRQVQERLGTVLTVARLGGDPPKSPIVWSAPSCPLRYTFQGDVTMSLLDLPADVPPSFGDQGLRIAGDVTLQAGDGDRTVIRNGEIELSQVMDGVKHPGGKEPPGALAEVRLVRDGVQWTEVDGPTGLWSAFGSFPGLVELWPALPSATAAGSKAPWALTIHGRGDGMKVESTRGTKKVPEGFELPTPTPNTLDAEVEVQGWLDVQGQPAVVLVAEWSHDDSSPLRLPEPETPASPTLAPPKIDLDVEVQARARYVVLASGRLLWADVHQITHVDMAMGEGRSMKQRHDLRATARLVEACDGPVMVEPPPAPSPEEAALETFALLRNVAVEGDADRIAEYLDPDLVGAHGKEPLAKLLHEHVTRLGVFSLGTPELTHDVRRDGDRVRMHMTGSVTRPDGTSTTVHAVAWARTRDGKTTITGIGIDAHERDEGWSILEISTARMTSGNVE